MVSIYKRGAKLYLQYKVNDKRKQRSTGLDDTPQNRRLLKTKVIPKLEAKIISGEIDEKPPAIFNTFADKYLVKRDDRKTAREIGSKVERIRGYFGKKEVRAIKRSDVMEFAADLLKTLSPKTTRNYVGILRAILQVAIDYEEIQTNPADSIELPRHTKKEIEPFTPEEVARLIDAADGWFRNFLAISFYTGLRTGEVIGLMQKDIDLVSMEIRVERSVSKAVLSTPKTVNGIRTVPVFSSAIPYIKDQMKRSRSLVLFPNMNGGYLCGADAMKRQWRKTCSDAGVEYRKLYATRHTFITSMLKSGTVSVLELAQIVGHANSEPIIKNYARFIKGEHLRISREIDPFSVTLQPTQVAEAR